jgi:hypothetical protein
VDTHYSEVLLEPRPNLLSFLNLENNQTIRDLKVAFLDEQLG